MMLRTQNADNLLQLSDALLKIATVREFKIFPTGD